MMHIAEQNRYDSMIYKRCGKSGLKLPAISLGLWHNFGHVDDFNVGKEIIFKAFDNGITHFDLANNYGPPPGSAEENFGKILNTHLKTYRDEMIISSKAGYEMWPGPYGDFGSKKYLISSLDQSLKRMNIDYVDIFYHHRPDKETPLEETMTALQQIVQQGKALYVGISNYSAEDTQKAYDLLKKNNISLLIHQPKYSMFERWIEKELTNVLMRNSIGGIAFSPLAQGMLTNKYLNGIPSDSRAAKEHGFLQESSITPQIVEKINQLNNLALKRGQSLAQMALAWVLNNLAITSVLVGVSKVSQLQNNIETFKNLTFSEEELISINKILN
ncbi:L-glyceraldehyde 3-phosphate reductase [Bacteroidota bacterium]